MNPTKLIVSPLSLFLIFLSCICVGTSYGATHISSELYGGIYIPTTHASLIPIENKSSVLADNPRPIMSNTPSRNITTYPGNQEQFVTETGPNVQATKLQWDKNGHYYQIVTKELNWNEAKTYAENQQFTDPNTGLVYKGHLATINSQEENSWIVQNLLQSANLVSINGKIIAVWLGGYQEQGYTGSSVGDWLWITDETWSWTNWDPGEPNDAGGKESFLQMYTNGKWNDNYIDGRTTVPYSLIEYEPSEQIQNPNVDNPSRTTTGQPIIMVPLPATKLQWDKNGHYYEIVQKELNWDVAKTYAESQEFSENDRGVIRNYKGHLATITSLEENSWIVHNLISPMNLAPKNGENFGLWLGGYQEENANSASEGWHWITGETWSWTNWDPGEPNDADGFKESYLQMWAIKGEAIGKWNDNDITGRRVINYILIEYEPSEQIQNPRVLLDYAHYKGGKGGQISELNVRNQGFLVDNLSVFPVEPLDNYDVILIDTPTKPYTSMEIQKIVAFIQNGGGLLIANDWAFGSGAVTSITNQILENIGISAIETNAGDGPFSKNNNKLKEHEITYDINAVYAGAVSRLDVPKSADILIQSDSSIIAAAIAYGAGRVVILGDNDLVDSNFGYDNAKFLKNILKWLSTNTSTPGKGCNGIISGHIYDTVTGNPIQGAGFTQCDCDCRHCPATDDKGYYEISPRCSLNSPCPWVTYKMTCEAEGYESETKDVKTDAKGNAVNQDFKLNPEAKPSCNSIIYDTITGKQAACVKANMNNGELFIDIRPMDGWGIPNTGSLVEMKQLQMKSAQVGTVTLGSGEDLSHGTASVAYMYGNNERFSVDVMRDGGSSIVTALLEDGIGLAVPIPGTGTLLAVYDQYVPRFQDSARGPNSNYFKDNNIYDQSTIAWPDQSVKFSGDLIDKAYVDYPNYAQVAIPISFDSPQHSNKMHIYVKVLLDSLHNYGGIIVGDQIFRYGSTEFEMILD
jgi:hypothetical protein